MLLQLARRQGARDRALECFRKAHSQLESLGAATAVEPLIKLGVVLSEAGDSARALQVLHRARAAADGMALSPLLALTNIALLPLFGAGRDDVGWDAAWGHASHLLEATGFVEPDIARQATIAARIAWSQGWGERAARVGALALHQWGRLGHDESSRDVRRLQKLLKAVQDS